MFKQSEHGKLLIDNGFEEDLNYCAQLNVFDIIPRYTNGVLKLMKEN